MQSQDQRIVIEASSLTTAFGSNVINDAVSFKIHRGDLVSVIGGSGSGKTTLLRALIGLLKPKSGSISLLGKDLWELSSNEREQLLRRISVLFQEGALFSGLTVIDNISFPVAEFVSLPQKELLELSRFWLKIVGLGVDVEQKMPSELSGGMKKRVALARALILEPDILFLDEPTSGLDPIAARKFDELILTLHEELGATIFMISHDLVSIKSLSSRVIALGKGTILADGSLNEVLEINDPWIKEYFGSGEVSSESVLERV